MAKKSKVTTLDIAVAAGVSRPTVSRVLNGGQNVSEDTVEIVQKTMENLEYDADGERPGPKGSKRRGGFAGTVVFLALRSNPEELYRKAVIPDLLFGVQEALSKNGLEFTLASSSDSREVPACLSQNRVAGVLLFGSVEPGGALKKALAKIPVVWCFRSDADRSHKYDHVFYDNSHIGEMAAEYLFERGHRQVAFANFYTENPAVSRRRETFVHSLTEKGATVKIVGETEEEDRYNLTRQAWKIAERLLAEASRPTGVFVPTDERMLALFNALRHFGVEPQRDIELIGCNNDQAYMNLMHPRPATIDIKTAVSAERAVEQLLWRMARPDAATRAEIFIPPEVVESEKVSGRRAEVSGRKSKIEGQRSAKPAEGTEELLYV